MTVLPPPHRSRRLNTSTEIQKANVWAGFCHCRLLSRAFFRNLLSTGIRLMLSMNYETIYICIFQCIWDWLCLCVRVCICVAHAYFIERFLQLTKEIALCGLTALFPFKHSQLNGLFRASSCVILGFCIWKTKSVGHNSEGYYYYYLLIDIYVRRFGEIYCVDQINTRHPIDTVSSLS